MANKSLGPRFQNYWIRAWCSNDSGVIFTKKNKINIDRKLYWIDKNHSYAIYPCKNNNLIFYDFWDQSEGSASSKDVIRINKKCFLYPEKILYVTLCSNHRYLWTGHSIPPFYTLHPPLFHIYFFFISMA